jgi:hypothetical protein
LKQIREGGVTLADLRTIQHWFSVDRYAPKGNKWKKEFPEGIKLVGFDKDPQTILKRNESAYGLDIDEWWASWLEYSKGRKS